MSAEDRAVKALDEFFDRVEYDDLLDPTGAAKAVLRALGSEGLAVVAKADLRVVALTVRKLPTENVDLRNDIADHLRRLSGANQALSDS